MNLVAQAESQQVIAPRRLAVIFNPVAGRGKSRRLARTFSILRDRGCQLDLHETSARGHAEELGRTINAAEADMIVAAGGDGTINEVINGMVAGGVALPLAVLPMGTANVLAAEISLSLEPSRIAETILQGEARPVVLGRANGRLFSVMAGAGFDAHVVANVNRALKKRIGKGAYVWESLRQLVRFPYPGYRVTVDGREYEAVSVIVAKGRHYAGKFVCAPKARLDEPHFQVCLFKRRGAWNVLRYALALGVNRLPKLPDLEIVEGREVSIEGPEGDPVQGDGDLVGHLPITVGLLPGAVRLVMPSAQ